MKWGFIQIPTLIAIIIQNPPFLKVSIDKALLKMHRDVFGGEAGCWQEVFVVYVVYTCTYI